MRNVKQKYRINKVSKEYHKTKQVAIYFENTISNEQYQ